ncbi:metal ABC transporter permease [Lysinibacillus mangiferihumi]|uniref:Metal ABC transporter permease n=1 Tax=Lysinibacillus mangiferihumi TaxID=1130819 RepID=A0A4U2Z8C3_9BACI|nr:metal ABC transporter permease [Lysinibacillus mangiferihumi]TKI70686.1 metal ABC transporter permease [Lysinibacillus mangiferihumi]
MIELWVIITGLLVGITCGMAGVFLILRKMSMIADAISHTVLFGIVMAFIITQTLNGFWMLLGAAVAGILTAYLVQLLHSSGIQQDAAIGVVFTTLFAAGVLLITLFASHVHLDVEHILMGEIAFVPWDKWTFFAITMPKAVWILLLVLLINIGFLLLFFKEMKLATFDSLYAASIGVPILFLHYGFMTSISFTTVAAFDSVGAILVVAMLIGPAATANLISKSIKQMFLFSMLYGGAAAIIGYYLAKFWDTSIAGMMATAVGLLFIMTLCAQKFMDYKRKALVSKLEGV